MEEADDGKVTCPVTEYLLFYILTYYLHLKTEAGPEAGDADRRLPAAARLLPHLPPAGPAPCPAPWWSRADVSPFPALLASPQTALLNYC